MATEKLSSARVLHLVPSSGSRDARPTVDVDTIECLKLLLSHAEKGEVQGIAFCAILKDRGYIADTAGEATRSPTFARGMVSGLDDKLAALIRSR